MNKKQCASCYNKYTSLVKYRFCSDCGKKLIIKEKLTGLYCAICGKRRIFVYLQCPVSFINRFFSLDHYEYLIETKSL